MVSLAEMQNHFSVDPVPGPVAIPSDELLKAGIATDIQGRSFDNGLVRFHCRASLERWTGIIRDRIRPSTSDILPLFFDWEGRQFFHHEEGARTYFFDPATKEIDWLTKSASELLGRICSDEGRDVLGAEVFEAARQHLGGPVLGYDECIGFVLPLFLGGDEAPSNREISNLEVFWEVSRQISEQISDVPDGTRVAGFDLKE